MSVEDMVRRIEVMELFAEAATLVPAGSAHGLVVLKQLFQPTRFLRPRRTEASHSGGCVAAPRAQMRSRVGQRCPLSQADIVYVRELYVMGLSYRAIERRTGIGRMTIAKHVRGS